MQHALFLILLGILGIALYSIVKAKEFIFDNTFLLSVFVKDNYKVWLWALSMIIVFATILAFVPTANELVKQFTGLDLTNTDVGWILLGAGLCGTVRNVKK